MFLNNSFKNLERSIMGTITNVDTIDPVAALTFDDGPHPKYTSMLLDVLENHQAKATFFMIGKNAQRYPKIVERIRSSGHIIGNHTWNHVSMPLLSMHKRKFQILSCAKALFPFDHRLFRPPYGQQSKISRLDALLLGYKVVTWNLQVEDWIDNNANSLYKKLAYGIAPGSIILLHDALNNKPNSDRRQMIEAVDMLLSRFGNKFSFVTLPELMRHGPSVKKLWYTTEH